MARIYKYYGTPTVSRSDMEEVRTDLGTVSVTPDRVRVGQYQTYHITYTVGDVDIQIGGVVRFSIPFGFAAPQAALPIRPGYVRAVCEKPGVDLKLEFRKSIWYKKSFTRTKEENNTEHTGANVYVRVTGCALTKGDQITLIYGDNSYGSEGAYAPNTLGPLQFDVAVDVDGQGAAPFSGFYLCSDVPFVHVLPLEACALHMIIPSNTVVGEPFKAIVAALDRFQNLAFDYTGKVVLYRGDRKLTELSFTPEDGGLQHAMLTLEEPGTVYLRAVDMDRGVAADSNPTLCTAEASKLNFYWGDIHGHSAIQWGQGSGEGYYEYGKEIAGLDFCSLSDPCAGRYTDDDVSSRYALSCYMTDEEWAHIQQLNRDFYKPGEFVPLLGYEYHNDAPAPRYGGDRNVYYATYDEPIFRCCDEGSYTPEQLWKRLKEHGCRAITIPCSMDFMAVSSYGAGTESSGRVRIIKDLDTIIQNKHVILVEDVLDSGITLHYLIQLLRQRQPASLRLVTLLDKPARRRAQVDVDYCGFQVPDAFLVGYGLDYGEKYRNLPDVCILKRSMYQK